MKLSRRLKATLRYGGRTVLAVAVVIGGYVGWLNLSGNFNTVIAGEVYRSAQPTAAALSTYAKDHGIRSIINLRGENTGISLRYGHFSVPYLSQAYPMDISFEQLEHWLGFSDS